MLLVVLYEHRSLNLDETRTLACGVGRRGYYR